MSRFITIHIPSVYTQRHTLYETTEVDYGNCKEDVINVDDIVCFNNEGIELRTGAKIRTKETIKELKELLQ